MTGRAIDDRAYAAAVAAGRLAAQDEFRAKSASYMAEHDAIGIVTTGGGGFMIPRMLIGALQDVPPAALAQMEVWPDGSVIEIEAHDIHIFVDGMIKAALPVLMPERVLAALGGTRRPSARRRKASAA